MNPHSRSSPSSGPSPSWPSAATRCLRPEDSGTTAEQLERAREAVRHAASRSSARATSSSSSTATARRSATSSSRPRRRPTRSRRRRSTSAWRRREGSIGFLLELAFDNELPRAGFRKQVVTIMTQVEVDAADPAFLKPSKPVGPVLLEGEGGAAAEDGGLDDGRRRRPRLAQGRRVAQAAGDARRRGRGGAHQPRPHRHRGGRRRHPGRRHRRGRGARRRGGDRQGLRGVDARRLALGRPLHRPDRSRARLAGLRQADAARAAEISAREAKALLAEGQFPPGSMGPKIDAAIRFVEAGGREVLVTRAESLAEALEGKTGTRIREAAA